MVKVCGITTEEDALFSVEAGATAIGFNFYSKSPRYITTDKAKLIIEHLPVSAMRVGVFVNESPANIAAIAAEVRLDVVQLHGDTINYSDAALETLRIWLALKPGTPMDDPQAEAYLIDTPSETLHGGTGQTFDWALASGHEDKLIVIAGGLDASNVRAAIEAAQPWGVDACSRLESSPGRKDPQKVRDFIQAALNL